MKYNVLSDLELQNLKLEYIIKGMELEEKFKKLPKERQQEICDNIEKKLKYLKELR